jgi:hypothetical protein
MDKGRATWKENIERDHPELANVLKDQRLATAKAMIAKAESDERAGDFLAARRDLSSAVESITQYDTLTNGSVSELVKAFKDEYKDFALTRDPLFKKYLEELLPIIKKTPGVLQTELYGKTALDKVDVSYCLYFADAGGIVRREKKGRSYQLSVIAEISK